MSEPSIIHGLDVISAAVADANSVINRGGLKRSKLSWLKRMIVGPVASSLQSLFNLFTRDGWYHGRLLNLYKPVGVETRAVLVVNGEPREIRYRAVLMDLLESMVMHRVAYDPDARRLLRESILEVLEDAMINYEGRLVTVREYFEMRGVPWSRAKSQILKEVDVALDILKRELDWFDHPRPEGYVRGDRLAYYMYVRDKMMRVNKTYEKIVAAVTTAISFSLGVALASRRLFDRKGLPAVTKRHAGFEEMLREMLDLPERLVSATLQAEAPYRLLNEYRFKLNKMLAANLGRAGGRVLGAAVTLPLTIPDLESYARKARGDDEERLTVPRPAGSRVA